MPCVFILLRALKRPSYVQVPHLFHRGIRAIFGFKVSFTGEMSNAKPTLFVSNHISYLDVFILGGIPAYFIAKSEVANWPVLGKFAKFQNTLFIERKAGRAKRAMQVMQHHLISLNSLILFPEGTSTDGEHVEVFKSSLFEAANLRKNENGECVKVAIQPISLAYTHQSGQKMNRTMLDYYAWYAKMPFINHFVKLFPLKQVDVKVHFHPVCYLEQFETRKECAEHCENIVSTKLDEFLK